MKKILLLIVLPLFIFFVPIAFSAYPQPTGFVNDYAHTLSPADADKLEKKLSDFQKQTTDEVTVVTIDSLGDQAIEDYSIGLAEQWKPGVKGKDNGVIILFAIQDHKDRIEVGRGLEGNLTDIQSSEILDDIKPQLRSSDYYGAFDTATTEVVNTISSTGSAAPIISNNNSSDGTGIIIVFILAIIFGVILFAVFSNHSNDFDGESEDSNDSEDDSDLGAFATGAVVGGIAGSAMSRESDDDSSRSSSSYSEPEEETESSSDEGGGFGGFSGGSFSGGGASGGW